MSAVAQLLAANEERCIKIVVIGDVLRDEYHEGEIARTAQEAPTLVLSGDHVYTVPGGAGNVARQLQHWHVVVHVVALLDAETAALLEARGIGTEFSVRMPTGHNPLKHRFYANGQLLLRQDVEQREYGEPTLAALKKQLLDSCHAALTGADIAILSDYDKGLFDGSMVRTVLETCAKAGVSSVVDPHPKRHPHDYAGCTAFKPNELYVRQRGVPFEFPDNLRWFKKALAPTRQMVYTRGAEPPRGFEGNRQDVEDFTCRGRSIPVPVRSMTGAGDCFAAHLALTLAHRLSFRDSCEIAYSAGRAYVQARHNRPVLPHEVASDLDPIAAKVITAAQARRILDARHAHSRIVFSNGVFRLLHPGHLATLRYARQQGDALIVGVNDDASARRCKPGAFVLPLADRAALLAGLDCVDFVVPFAEDDPGALLRTIRPTVLVKGPDYAGTRGQIAGVNQVDEVLLAPQTPWTRHVTDIVASIRQLHQAELRPATALSGCDTDATTEKTSA
jgi:D-beta-D-heptose 7-phosphate kinase/D-beta-D-heptose 1-phosphate adenosyltransferase